MTGMDDTAEQLRRKLETELPPALAEFGRQARSTITQLAGADGWSEDQAAWLAERALVTMVEDLAAGVPPEQALADGYKKACQALSREVFDGALARGAERDVAFLLLIELEKEMAARRGEAPPPYSTALQMAGCQAVASAAAEGASSADQIETGFAMMRQLAREFGDGEGEGEDVSPAAHPSA